MSSQNSLSIEQIKKIIEAAVMAAGQPLTIDRMMSLFVDDDRPGKDQLRQAIVKLQEDCEERGVELKEVASGFRYQAKQELAPWVARLWEERPPRYSRALLETLVLIAYRQPITRGEIEHVRGVSVSSHIIRTLLERDWVKVVGHRDVPGRPAIYATTKGFLDYFNLKSLEMLPTMVEIRDLDKIKAELVLEGVISADDSSEDADESDAVNKTGQLQDEMPTESVEVDNDETTITEIDADEVIEGSSFEGDTAPIGTNDEDLATAENELVDIEPSEQDDDSAVVPEGYASAPPQIYK